MLFAIITADSWPRIQKALRRQMRIDVPGTGIAFIVPVSSIGGKRALLFLTEHQTLELKEESTLKDTRYDLLLVIANSKKLLGNYTNSVIRNVLGGISAVATLGLAIRALYNLITTLAK